MTGVEEIMCDLTCTWTKRLVTWLVFGPNDLWLDLTWRLTKWLVTWLGLARKWLVTWLDLDLHGNDLWLDLDLQGNDLWLDLDLHGNDLWLDLDLQGNDLWLDLDLQKMTCCHLCYYQTVFWHHADYLASCWGPFIDIYRMPLYTRPFFNTSDVFPILL